MNLEAFALGATLGLIRRRSVRAIALPEASCVWLFALAALLTLLPVLVSRFGAELPAPGLFHLLAHAAWLAALLTNLRLPGIPLAVVGVALNFLVVAANGGRMPVSTEAASRATGVAAEAYAAVLQQTPYHQAMEAGTRLAVLGDRVAVPERVWFPPALVSVGDLFIALALLVFGFGLFSPNGPRPATETVRDCAPTPRG